MKTLFILLLAVATGGYATAQDTGHSGTAQRRDANPAADTSVSAFIIKAMKSSEMEIEAGRLAQQRAQSADVKAYGGRMIADHSKTSNELRPIALKHKVDLTVTNAQDATGSGANRSGSNVQTGRTTTSGTTGNTTGTTGNTSTGNNQTTRSAGTTTTTGTTGTTSTGNNQTTRSAGTTTTSGTTGNTSTGNDQTTRSAGTTATTGTTGTTTTTTTSGNNNAGGNVNKTTNSSNTTRTGNNANYDSNNKSAGQAMIDTSRHASHEEKLNLLKQQSGADFDRQYMQMMVKDHTKAVKMFEKASNYTDTEVRAFAAKNLPVLREHLASAQRILSSLQGTNQSGNNSGNNN